MQKIRDYKVREANEEDVIDLSILGRHFAKESEYDKFLGWSSSKVHASLLDAIKRDDLLVLCLCSEEEVVGMFIGFVAPAFFSDKIQGSEIAWYVLPEHRKSRKAFEMLDLYEEWAKELGAVCVNLVNLEKLNPEGVAKMYSKRGYSVTENSFTKEL